MASQVQEFDYDEIDRRLGNTTEEQPRHSERDAQALRRLFQAILPDPSPDCAKNGAKLNAGIIGKRVEATFEQVFRCMTLPPVGVREIHAWLYKTIRTCRLRREEEIGRRFIALAWVIDPAFFSGSPSLNGIAQRMNVRGNTLAPVTAEASRAFGVLNRAQAHGWNRRSTHTREALKASQGESQRARSGV